MLLVSLYPKFTPLGSVLCPVQTMVLWGGKGMGKVAAAQQEEMPSSALAALGVPGILAAVLRLVSKYLLCQGQPVPVQMLLLAEKIPGQNFKELREDVGC